MNKDWLRTRKRSGDECAILTMEGKAGCPEDVSWDRCFSTLSITCTSPRGSVLVDLAQERGGGRIRAHTSVTKPTPLGPNYIPAPFIIPLLALTTSPLPSVKVTCSGAHIICTDARPSRPHYYLLYCCKMLYSKFVIEWASEAIISKHYVNTGLPCVAREFRLTDTLPMGRQLSWSELLFLSFFLTGRIPLTATEKGYSPIIVHRLSEAFHLHDNATRCCNGQAKICCGGAEI